MKNYPIYRLTAYILKDGDHSQMDDHYNICTIYETNDEDDAWAQLERVRISEHRPQVNLMLDDSEETIRLAQKDEHGIYW